MHAGCCAKPVLPLKDETFAPQDLTLDSFLGGAVRLYQPKSGYRAGIDPVFLAASVPASAGDRVLELGCGAGPALCCLGRRVPGVSLTGLELQPAYADLARRNTASNGFDAMIADGDLRAPPSSIKSQSFDYVMLNPPYFEPGSRAVADRPDRELALAGETPLSDWIDCAARRTRPKGWVHVIQRAERLPELLTAMSRTLGSIGLLPLLPRAGRGPRLILVRGRKEGRAAFRFHPGIVLHQNATHERDAEDYTAEITAVVRSCQALPFPD